MPVVLVLVASVTNLLLLFYSRQPIDSERFYSLAFGAENILVVGNTASVESFFPIDSGSFSGEGGINFIIVDSDALLNSGNPLSNVLPTRDGLLIYKVQSGDNLSKIAANFGISLNTIFWANPSVKARLLSPGQEIMILPVSGVLHQVQAGETLESIANLYSIDVQRILQLNLSARQELVVGSNIIIPDAKPVQSSRLASLASLPDLSGYFAIPTTGWNWGRLHNYNAVDIANACGTPIYAAAEGLILESVSNNGWNDGYGNYILIEHSNGTFTKYSHNQRNVVSPGDYVLKGDSIGYIGNTGNVHGPTGCHLHFEVRNAKNPFAK